MLMLKTASVLAAGALSAGLALPLTATATEPPSTGNPAASCAHPFFWLPTALREDLRAAHRLVGPERRAALVEIRRAALAGEYGERVQRMAERRDARLTVLWHRLPADLREDIWAMRQLPVGEERAAARAEIRKAALAGEYGERVQRAAERIRAHREWCRAHSA